MGKVVAEISMSLDGYVAGPNPSLEEPLGEGGEQVHEWAYGLKSWREPHELPGGETGVMQGGTTFTFVTEGIESAVEDARAAAAEKNVSIAGGANAIDQCINAGLVDELLIHLSPVLLGGGTRLFEGVGPEQPRFERTNVLDSPLATHLRYRIVR
jgi:hypothetical protein